MLAKVVLVSFVIAAASARPDDHEPHGYGYQPPRPNYSAPPPQRTYSDHHEGSSEEEEPRPFKYAFVVKDDESGNDFYHGSDSDGVTVTGEYRVALPDGRTQIVKYSSTKTGGYLAEVTYEGEVKPYVPPKKHYEEPKPTYSEPKPTYEQPKPTYQIPQRTYGANF